MPAVDLRELVKAPIELTGSFAESKNSHPIHEGIAGTKQYSSPSAPPIVLPRGGRGLQRLREAIHAPVAGMDPERTLESYVKLLASATAIHTTPGLATFDGDGQPLTEVLAARTRSVLLTAVFQGRDTDFDGEAPRFGAVGTLTVLPAVGNPRMLDDAWLNVEWVYSSSVMLGEILRVPGLQLQEASVNRGIDILVAGELVEEREHLTDEVSQLAMMVGAKPRTLVVTPQTKGVVASKVRAANPFELISLGSGVDESVISEFTRRSGERHLHRARVSSADRALQWSMDNFPHIMGVGASLVPDAQAESVPGRPRMPVKNPVRCLHHGDNRYVLDGDSEEWWTRDHAQHGTVGKSIFKTFVLTDGMLHWRADHDGAGAVIEGKHKGPKGIRIAESDTGSCQHPASHLN